MPLLPVGRIWRTYWLRDKAALFSWLASSSFSDSRSVSGIRRPTLSGHGSHHAPTHHRRYIDEKHTSMDCCAYLGISFLINMSHYSLTIIIRTVVYFTPLQGAQSNVGRGGSVVAFGAFRPEGCRFESHYSRHVMTLDKSFTRSCP